LIELPARKWVVGSRAPQIRRVRNRHIVRNVIAGVFQNAFDADHAVRRSLFKQMWIELKRYGARGVRNIEIADITGLHDVTVDGPIWRHDPLVLSALSIVLRCENVFEFGTYLGDTTWLLAHNLPNARISTLDLPARRAADSVVLELTDRDELFQRWDRGARLAGTPEEERVTLLRGDSATFDFSPYSGSMDLVYIDASHSYSYVASDTDAAFGMLSELGTIVWDDYTYYPGIYAYLNEIAPALDRPIYHIVGTRLALYTRRDIVA